MLPEGSWIHILGLAEILEVSTFNAFIWWLSKWSQIVAGASRGHPAGQGPFTLGTWLYSHLLLRPHPSALVIWELKRLALHPQCVAWSLLRSVYTNKIPTGSLIILSASNFTQFVVRTDKLISHINQFPFKNLE